MWGSAVSNVLQQQFVNQQQRQYLRRTEDQQNLRANSSARAVARQTAAAMSVPLYFSGAENKLHVNDFLRATTEAPHKAVFGIWQRQALDAVRQQNTRHNWLA